MFGKLVFILTCILLPAALLCAKCTAAENKEVVKLAIMLCTEPLKAFRMFHEIVEYLTKETGMEVQLQIRKSDEEFFNIIEAGKFDFAFQDAAVYAELAENYNTDYILQVIRRDGKFAEHGEWLSSGKTAGSEV